MATGGKLSASLSKGNEEFFEYCCTPCFKDDTIIEAIKQCIDCNEYYCGKCIRFHDKFAATSSHNVVDKTQMRKVQGSKPKIPLPTQRCQDHHRDRITTFCADHDVVCCNTCVSINHKNCDGITYIVDVAKGIKSGSQLKSAKANITATLTDLKKEIASCKKNMADLVNCKTSTVKKVKDLTERLIKRIQELERITIKQIDSTFKDHSDEAGTDVTYMDGMVSVMEEDLQNLDQIQQNSDSTVFVDVKLGQRHEAEGRKIRQQVVAHRKVSPRFVLKTDAEQFLNDLPTLGNFPGDITVFKAKLNGDYNINVRQDTKTSNIVGSCLLPDGTLMITDFRNKRLKRLDASFRVTDHCDMPSEPWGVTCTALDEVAVTLQNRRKVQFVSVRGYMSLTRSFKTSYKCRGIHLINDELFVSCGGGDIEESWHVAVYSINGTHIRTLQNGPSGQQLFSSPRHITASPDGARIYVADYDGGVVSSDRSGKSVVSFTDPSLKGSWDVCHLDNGHVVVSGWKSHNVLQFDSDGKRVTELLNETDGINKPKSLCYNIIDSSLVVTMGDNDNIKVFDLA